MRLVYLAAARDIGLLTRLETVSAAAGRRHGRPHVFVCVDFDKRVQFFIIAVNPFG